MIKIISLSWLAMMFSSVYAQDTASIQSVLTQNLPAVTQIVHQALSKSRYMEETKVATVDNLAGYKGIKVDLYKYSWNGEKLIAYVYALHASDQRIARWLITSSYQVTGRYDVKDIRRLLNLIKGQSGAQFPVLGVVLENDEDNFFSPYVYFKDGITVSVKDEILKQFRYDTTEINSKKGAIKQVTFRPENLRLLKNQNLKKCYYKGRIISTTRQEYKVAGGKQNVDNFNFMTIVKNEYIKALNSDYNFLIYAKAKNLLK